jgi:branched-chain amino acid transport system permease protein
MALFGRRNVLLMLLLVAAVAPSFVNDYYLFVGNTILIYVLLSIGLNILVGYTGQLAFANAAMFGIGAYGTGLLQVRLGWPFWLAFPAGAVIATTVGSLSRSSPSGRSSIGRQSPSAPAGSRRRQFPLRRFRSPRTSVSIT